MKLLRKRSLALWALLGASMVVGAVALGRGFFNDQAPSSHPAIPSYPSLFESKRRCPDGSGAIEQASKLEQRAQFHSERYPYDAEDGVRAVQRYREASSCYREHGFERAADRTEQLAIALIERIEVDYASARLVLATALEEERWAVAHSEVDRLRSLTAHLAADRYVDWLREISGKVAIRAGATR